MRFGAISVPAKGRASLILALAASVVSLVMATSSAEAAFPGDNGVIAFASDRITPQNPEGDLEIFLHLPGSGTVTQLTSNDQIDAEPTWSPDGTQIAFTSSRDSNPGLNFEIYKMDADGSNQVRLTNNASWDQHPAWSPSGTKLAFESQRNNGNPEIYKMNANGTEQVRLTKNPAYDSEPAWSPNGKRLAFTSTRNAGTTDIYKMRPVREGRENRPLRLTNNEEYDYSPDWSPDGTKLAFWTNRDGNFEVYTMNADGSGSATNLTGNGARQRGTRHPSLLAALLKTGQDRHKK